MLLITFFSILCGLNLSTIFNFLNILQGKNGQDGVLYYGEVHLTYWNSMIHTIFMPITIYGILLWLPAIFGLSKHHSYKLQWAVYVCWISHYKTIDEYIALMTAFYYMTPLLYSMFIYRKNTILNNIKIGFFIMTIALLIQEYVGHYYGGDEWSRPEGVLNAICYAPYYSVSHMFLPRNNEYIQQFNN